MKQAIFPAIIALIMTFERSLRREGAIAPKAPSWIPIDAILENPHRAYVDMTTDLFCEKRVCVLPLKMINCRAICSDILAQIKMNRIWVTRMSYKKQELLTLLRSEHMCSPPFCCEFRIGHFSFQCFVSLVTNVPEDCPFLIVPSVAANIYFLRSRAFR